eukprot:scaffold3594_cov138-Cylindrotheca_fusiformis.AAC.1
MARWSIQSGLSTHGRNHQGYTDTLSKDILTLLHIDSSVRREIPANAFCHCRAYIEACATFGNTETSIGNKAAFDGCNKLDRVCSVRRFRFLTRDLSEES